MKKVGAIVIIFAASVARPQTEAALTARELFYVAPSPPAQPKAAPQKPQIQKVNPRSAKPAKSEAADTAQTIIRADYSPLALKYTILQRAGDSFKEVDPEMEFHTGDRIRVKVAANTAAFLYIVMRGSSGKWQVLFPSKEIANGDNHIEKGRAYLIPPEDRQAFYFDETAGVEKVSLVLSRTPEPDLEKLIYSVGEREQKRTILAENRPIDDAILGHVRNEMLSRDLVFEKYDGSTPEGTPEKAVYAATRDKSPDARLFVDLSLIHK